MSASTIQQPDKPVESSELTIVLVGNPNTGKTTLFNALTGLRQRVGNYPGVTVEMKSGQARFDGRDVTVLDVPGTYSLSPRSPDEMVAVDLMLGHKPEIGRPQVIVCILDASNLDRNLYLGSQVLELGLPVVFALNMLDVADGRGIAVDPEKLSQQLGAPVVPIQANVKRGIGELQSTVVSAAQNGPPTVRPLFPEAFQQHVAKLRELFRSTNGDDDLETYLIERALIDAGGQTEIVLTRKYGEKISDQLHESRQALKEAGCAVPAVEAKTRYRWIAERLEPAVTRPSQRPVTFSDRLDRILLHKVWGVAVFIGLMAIVFQSIFTWAGPLMEMIDGLFGVLGGWATAVIPEGAFQALVVDGLIGGVGGVLVFLPQIVILFAFIAILEDCGYMARAAFLMDKVMARCGLSGKSFVPMLSSFACAIPGVMATRTIADRRDRLVTILVAPLMSCSARLPVYMLLIRAFIPEQRLLGFISIHAVVLLSLYLVGLIVAPLVAWTLKKTIVGGDAPVFLMELPDYKFPSVGTVCHRMFDRGWAFVRRAGTIILASTVVVWALQYYPRPDSIAEQFAARTKTLTEERKTIEDSLSQLPDGSEERAELQAELASLEDRLTVLENKERAAYQEQSYLGWMGKKVEPVVKPLGWDWRIGMAAIASFPAREVIVAALGTIYQVGSEVDEESVPLHAALRTATWPDGSPVFNIPVALSIMVFFALCCQCAATLAVIWRETNSLGWPIFCFVYMTLLAYLGAFVVYQIGIRLA